METSGLAQSAFSTIWTLTERDRNQALYDEYVRLSKESAGMAKNGDRITELETRLAGILSDWELRIKKRIAEKHRSS